MSISQRCQRERGVTLIELVLFIVIVGLASAAILGVMSLTTQHSADPQLRKQALAIAESIWKKSSWPVYVCDPQDPAAEPAAKTAAAPPGVADKRRAAGRPFDSVNEYVGAYGAATAYTTDGGRRSGLPAPRHMWHR